MISEGFETDFNKWELQCVKECEAISMLLGVRDDDDNLFSRKISEIKRNFRTEPSKFVDALKQLNEKLFLDKIAKHEDVQAENIDAMILELRKRHKITQHYLDQLRNLYYLKPEDFAGLVMPSKLQILEYANEKDNKKKSALEEVLGVAHEQYQSLINGLIAYSNLISWYHRTYKEIPEFMFLWDYSEEKNLQFKEKMKTPFIDEFAGVIRNEHDIYRAPQIRISTPVRVESIKTLEVRVDVEIPVHTTREIQTEKVIEKPVETIKEVEVVKEVEVIQEFDKPVTVYKKFKTPAFYVIAGFILAFCVIGFITGFVLRMILLPPGSAELQKLAVDAQTAKNDALTEKDRAIADKDKAESDLKSANENINELNKQLKTLEETRANLEADKDKLSTDLQTLTDEHDAVVNERDDLKIQLEKAKKELENLQAQVESRADISRNSLSELNAKIAEQQKQIEELQNQLKLKDDELLALKKLTDEQIAELKQKLLDTENELAVTSEKLYEIKLKYKEFEEGEQLRREEETLLQSAFSTRSKERAVAVEKNINEFLERNPERRENFEKAFEHLKRAKLIEGKKSSGETAKEFKLLAELTDGTAYPSPSANDLPGILTEILNREIGLAASADICLIIDTTSTMGNDIDALKKGVSEITANLAGICKDVRVAVVLYRDLPNFLGDPGYVTKIQQAFTLDMNEVIENIKKITLNDGTGNVDIPEAVFEGIVSSLTELSWSHRAEKRLIILMGDAPPATGKKIVHNPKTGKQVDMKVEHKFTIESIKSELEKMQKSMKKESLPVQIFPIIIAED